MDRKARRSDVIKKGLSRAPHRAFMHAMGLSEEDFEKPYIAVMGPYNSMTPCNMHLDMLMKRVATGIAEGGGVARESGWL